MEKTNHANEKAVLVSIAPATKDLENIYKSLDELERLLETAGGEAVARLVQVKEKFEPATCLGAGKCEELRELCEHHEVTLCVFDFDLSPSQIRNLEDITNTRVMDRTMLILDIFALHAVTGEGKLQIELAQLRYTAPRLMGKGLELSRLGGGIGTRGPGESKLETDRRHLNRRILSLENSLIEMENNRKTMRAQRDRSGLPKIAIVGYTNAGKSTLLNTLTNAGVLSEDKLFATLDPTTRKLALPENEEVLLTDTVGLIRHLPHHLINAFKSTLDEMVYADILLLVIDSSDPEWFDEYLVTMDLLHDLKAADKPILFCYNKCDNAIENFVPVESTHRVCISAKTGDGMENLLFTLLTMIRENKKQVTLFFSFSEQNMLYKLHKDCAVISIDYVDSGCYVKTMLAPKDMAQYAPYICDEGAPS